jgi:hypothetical protein
VRSTTVHKVYVIHFLGWLYLEEKSRFPAEVERRIGLKSEYLGEFEAFAITVMKNQSQDFMKQSL